MAELIRLMDCGIRVGFATGRGGTAGDRLREALPAPLHDRVLVGYYNGAHVRTLDVDIRLDRPAVDSSVAAVAEWIRRSDVLLDTDFLAGPVQVTITHAQLRDATTFVGRLSECFEIATGRASVLSSQHSFDIVAAGSSKLTVVRALAAEGGAGLVLCVGDSGSPLGNDRALLSGPHGVSVGSVCGSYQGAWTLFGSQLRGPDALVRLLRAASVADGTMQIDVARLDPDRGY